MSVATTIHYAEATVSVTSALGGTRAHRIFSANGTVFPGGHLPPVGTFNVNYSFQDTGTSPPGGFLTIALVRDASDVGGDFVGPAAVVEIQELGSPPTAGTIYSRTFNTPTSPGTYRLVLSVAINQAGANDHSTIDTTGTSAQWATDSDGNTAQGGLSTQTFSSRVSGSLHVFIDDATLTAPDNQAYRDNPQYTVTGDLNGNPSNPKSIGVAVSPNADGTGAIKSNNAVVNATGGFSFTYNVDTQFPAAASDYYLHAYLDGNIASHKPDLYGPGQTVVGLAAEQQSWTKFNTVTAPLVKINDSRVRSAGDTTIGSGIYLYQDAGMTTPGVSSWRSAAYTTQQNIFRRRGPTLTTNSSPHLQTYIFDALGNPINNLSVTMRVKRTVNGSTENTQNLTTDANGRLRGNYTLTNNAPAFSTMVKAGATRQANGHVATGPDSYLTPPATFSIGASDYPADYPGPYPGYPRNVEITGNETGSNEPVATATNVFGVSSEILFEDTWTGPITSTDLDGNGVPIEAGSRDQALGAGSLKAKVCTLINEGNIKVITPSEHNPKDIAGRKIVVTTDNLYLRRALFNATNKSVIDAGSNPNDSQTKLENSIGYNFNSNSFDTIAAPSDSASMILYHGYADTLGQRDSFSLSVSGDSPVTGYTNDVGNFGYRAQTVTFAALDSTIKLIVIPDVIQSDPTLVRRFILKIIRLTKDPLEPFVDALADEPPLYSLYGGPATGKATLLETGLATQVAGEDASNWEVLFTVPVNYAAVKLYATAVSGGARTIGGSEQGVQIGFTFDATGFATGFNYK